MTKLFNISTKMPMNSGMGRINLKGTRINRRVWQHVLQFEKMWGRPFRNGRAGNRIKVAAPEGGGRQKAKH